ncbi:MAG: hypothetical protein ACLFNK_05590 [Candidatus Woesearchaeota archaeon]
MAKKKAQHKISPSDKNKGTRSNPKDAGHVDDTKHPKEVALKIKAEQTRTTGMHLTQIFALLLLVFGIFLLIYVNLNVDVEGLQDSFDPGLADDVVDDPVSDVKETPEQDTVNETSGDNND